MTRTLLTTIGILAALGLSSCDNNKGGTKAEAPTKSNAPSEASGAEGTKAGQGDVALGVDPASKPASVGQPAPGFTLKDLSGKQVSLSDHQGKIVVLEWFNPECPFVKRSHEKGSLRGLAVEHHDKNDVVWLAINSGAEGRQGHGLEVNREAVQKYSLPHPVLLDETGSVGKAYGATNTPHMFVIDKQGKLAYAGAIDNSPDGEGEAAPNDELVNYVTQALSELRAGKPVSEPKTKAYGCSVKYAS